MTELNIEQLKAAALAATPIETCLYGDRYFQGSYSKAELSKAQNDFLTMASPNVVLELIGEIKRLRSESEAIPYAYEIREGGETSLCYAGYVDKYRPDLADKIKQFLYTAPPAPVSAEPSNEEAEAIIASFGQHSAAVSFLKKLGHSWNSNSAEWVAPPSTDAKDAARYRWLKSHCYDTEPAGDGDAFDFPSLHFEDKDLHPWDQDSLDSAIDAAIAAKEAGTHG